MDYRVPDYRTTYIENQDEYVKSLGEKARTLLGHNWADVIEFHGAVFAMNENVDDSNIVSGPPVDQLPWWHEDRLAHEFTTELAPDDPPHVRAYKILRKQEQNPPA